MACFASSRRSGWVRVLVLILCALFIFAILGAPPAQALGVESVAVFGLASVLSAATAALGFKLASNEQGQATLQKMVQDFKTVAWATGFVLVGSKLNGLQNGMDYIKMQIQNGKTYLDSRVFAWVQQWLAKNGVYDSGAVVQPDSSVDYLLAHNNDNVWSYWNGSPSLSLSAAAAALGVNLSGLPDKAYEYWNKNPCFLMKTPSVMPHGYSGKENLAYFSAATDSSKNNQMYIYITDSGTSFYRFQFTYGTFDSQQYANGTWTNGGIYMPGIFTDANGQNAKIIFNFFQTDVLDNDSGLSGTDTLGKDVVDLTLDQVLQKLKEWAQDWFDAGADSATNAATGALDLPLTVATGAATANPSIAEDGPLVWFPPFSVPIPNLRTGETDSKTVDQGKENASAAETSTVDVAENQTVIDSLVNWALSYISPDTGLFSKFPLCVPYDAYLLVTSSLGVDAVGSDSIFGASPGDLEGVVSQDIDTYSDFQPIINIKHDFELDGKTYPVELTIDLTPWQPFVTFFREGMALLLIAELIGSEFKRIRGH